MYVIVGNGTKTLKIKVLNSCNCELIQSVMRLILFSIFCKFANEKHADGYRMAK